MARKRTSRLILLGAAALGLAGILALSLRTPRTIIVQPAAPANLTGPAQTAPSLTTALAGNVVGNLLNPRYTGRTATGGMWEITASQASQYATQQEGGRMATTPDPTRQGTVSLTTLTATWQPDDKTPPLKLNAPSAIYQPGHNLLRLPAGVQAQGEGGGLYVVLKAAQGKAFLASQTLHLGGGVSATLRPR